MNPENKTVRDVLAYYGTDSEYGLSNKQVEENRSRFGRNKLKDHKKVSIIVKFFMQFNDFMIVILLIAAAVSFFISYLKNEVDFLDPIIILAIVTMNAVLGVLQESKAEKALEALKKMSAPMAKVIRASNIKMVTAEELVPGDIILLESGDFVPADARLISSSNLKAEESALTGESLPVEKEADILINPNSAIGDRKNMVYSSSSVSAGKAKAIVCFTGMETEVGKIADMIISDESPQTPLQKKLEQTGKTLGIGALLICGIIFVLGIFKHMEPFEMFMTSVSLAVAAIPEGLPAIVTIMLAIGVQRMAREKAIIRKLPAVETLGSANVICSDKTGTLTQNKMKVVEIADTNGKLSSTSEKNKTILEYASLCNDSSISAFGDIIGDPTESSIIIAASSLELDKKELDLKFARVGEIPFDSKRKLMSTIHKINDGFLIITKGAPDVLIKKCTEYLEGDRVSAMNLSKYNSLNKINSQMAEKALRVLGVAYKKVKNFPDKYNEDTIENNLTYMGFIGIIDPPREEAYDAVKTCKKAGIKPVMVTGDHIITAKAIAEKLGILEDGDKAMTGDELNNLSQEELNNIIEEYSVFARLAPEHKVRIVKAFQSRGDIVAMTGDGVNDAPALKAADIGCAMGINGTDVAKGAADMVLADDNFATIVCAVKEGRGIYSNIRKAVHFLLSSNIGEIITILVAILIGFDTPLLAIQLLWVNLVTDSLPAIALGLEPPEKGIMQRKPFSSQKSLFADGLWSRIICEGLMVGFLALIAFGIGAVYYDFGSVPEIGRTMAFSTLSISQLVHAFNMRSDKSILRLNLFENIYLVYAFIIGVILQVLVITIEPLAVIFKVKPLSLENWFTVVLLCLMPIVIVELEKFFTSDEKEASKFKIFDKSKSELKKMKS